MEIVEMGGNNGLISTVHEWSGHFLAESLSTVNAHANGCIKRL